MKGILLFSGGMDSATLLYDLIRQGQEITPVFFNYGQKAYKREKQAVENICKELGLKYIEIDITGAFAKHNNALLENSKEVVAEVKKIGNHTEIKGGQNELKFRNGVFISVALSLAMELFKNEKVAIYLAIIDCRTNYKDCSKAFVATEDYLCKLYSSCLISISTPYIDYGKDDVYRVAKELNVPIEKTWSCYNGGSEPCGICPACIDRKIVEGKL